MLCSRIDFIADGLSRAADIQPQLFPAVRCPPWTQGTLQLEKARSSQGQLLWGAQTMAAGNGGGPFISPMYT